MEQEREQGGQGGAGRARAPAPPDAEAARAPARWEAAVLMLSWRLILGGLELRRQPGMRLALLVGVQAALASAAALTLAHLSPWPDAVGFAGLGAQSVLYGRFVPRWRRGRVVLGCGLMQAAAVAVLSGAGLAGAPTAALLALMAAACGVFYFVAMRLALVPPGALVLSVAAGAAMAPIEDAEGLIRRVAATAAGALIAALVCLATEVLRRPPADGGPPVPGAARPARRQAFAAARVALGCGLAAGASHLAGGLHPAWAAVGALAVMQGAQLHVTLHRALQRMAGTAIGAALLWLALKQTPSIEAVIALIVVLQLAVQLVIGANYALGQVLVTPMALLTTLLATHAAPTPALAAERVGDTIVGACLGLALAIVFSTLDDRAELRRARDAARAARPGRARRG